MNNKQTQYEKSPGGLGPPFGLKLILTFSFLVGLVKNILSNCGDKCAHF